MRKREPRPAWAPLHEMQRAMRISVYWNGSGS